MNSDDPVVEIHPSTRRRRENLTTVACVPCRQSKLKVSCLCRPGIHDAFVIGRLTRESSAMDPNLYVGPATDDQEIVSMKKRPSTSRF